MNQQFDLNQEFLKISQDLPICDSDNIFGLTIPKDMCSIILLPVPWQATASYHKGTLLAYKGILEASHYIDLQSSYFPEAYRACIYMEDNPRIFQTPSDLSESSINNASKILNDYVYSYSKNILDQSKYLALIGGEHSIPYGLIKALVEKYSNFTVLHIDAHHDLRASYEGYKHSHASIIYNIIQDFPSINVISYGVRDYCKQELDLATSCSRITTFYDRYDSYYKDTLESTIDSILKTSKDNLYISFDIDGLDPSNCPNTGTPVPGGIPFNVARYLISRISQEKKIIGFDLSEVGVSENLFDENVASRILYELCGAMSYSNKLI